MAVPPPAAAVADPATAPLADRMRPRSLEEMAGQAHLRAPGQPLRAAILAGQLHSMIF